MHRHTAVVFVAGVIWIHLIFADMLRQCYCMRLSGFMCIMARSHWQFSQASDFLGSEAIYLDIFTLAIFPSNFYIYFICLFAKITHLNGYSTLLKVSDFFLASENHWKVANVNIAIEYTSIH